MIRRLVAFLLGYLRIEARGGHVEHLLNLALQEQILLWQIERSSDRLYAYMLLRDFFALWRMGYKTRGRIRILGRHGLPFLAVRLRRRPVLWVGALCCLAFFLWVSSHIWFIRVKIIGPGNLDPRAVAGVAAEAGLRPGVRKRALDMGRVQAHVQQRMSEVSWVVIRLQGTRAVIEVVEKAARQKAGVSGCVNLIARKNGVIAEVIPFVGEAVVKKGDRVRAGDLLVECSLRYWSGGRPSVLPGMPLPPRESVARTQVAQARVMARIQYEEYREVPLYREVPVPTGRKQVYWVLNWKEKPIIQLGKKPNPFDRYQEVQASWQWGAWRNWKLPVEVVKVTIDEVRIERERISVFQALQEVQEQMTVRLRWILGPSDKMLTPPKAEALKAEGEVIGVSVTAETLEEISVPERPAVVPAPAGP